MEQLKCIVCLKPAEHHHVKSRGSGGGDESSNLMPLCRTHHTEIHWSRNKFVEKYRKVCEWLLDRGWELDEFSGKWFHRKGPK